MTLDEMARAHGHRKAMPDSQTPFPDVSRNVMALHFQKSFEEGFCAALEEAAKLFDNWREYGNVAARIRQLDGGERKT